MSFLSSLFGTSRPDDTQKAQILRDDGVRAMQMGEIPYSVKCLKASLELRPDASTEGLLAEALLRAGETAEALPILEKFAQQGDCVIVGRCADVILKDYHPLNLFVYADMDAKVERCMKRAPEGEHLTRAEMEKAIRRIDKERAQNHLMYADTKWGSREAYHLCINTTHREIKKLIPSLAQFCKDWFAE